VTITDDDGGTDGEALDMVVTGDADRDFGGGYWKHQYRGTGKPQLPAAYLAGYLEIVRFVSGVFAEDVALATSADATAILSPFGGNKRAVARSDLLQAWLHFASGAVEWDASIPLGGGGSASFLDVMNEIEDVVSNPASTNSHLVRASQLAQRVRQA
jgi:hypothetical protein